MSIWSDKMKDKNTTLQDIKDKIAKFISDRNLE